MNDEHDDFLTFFDSCNGFEAKEMFLNQLYEDDMRLQNEYEREYIQDNSMVIDIMNMEFMDKMDIAVYQWYTWNQEGI